MSLLVETWGKSIDYVMKNGKKIAEKGGKTVYEHVNADGRRYLLSTKNGKPFRMVTGRKQYGANYYTIANDFEKNRQVHIFREKLRTVKHEMQLDPTCNMNNKQKSFIFFKASDEDCSTSVRIEDRAKKLIYQAFHDPVQKVFRVGKIEYPHFNSVEVERCSDTSTNGAENFRNFIRKYSGLAKAKPVETASENIAKPVEIASENISKPAPTMLDKFTSLFNKNNNH